jgi:hypothetical protein
MPRRKTHEQAPDTGAVRRKSRRSKVVSAPGKSQRKLARIFLLVAVGLVGVAGGFILMNRAARTSPIYVVSKTIPAGAKITSADIGVANVPYPGAPGAAPLRRILSGRATVGLLPGEILTNVLVSSGSLPVSEAVIGLSVASGHMPNNGVAVGSRVEMVYTGGPSSASGSPGSVSLNTGSILAKVVVTYVSSGTGTPSLDVLVPAKIAPALEVAAANGNVALVRISG